MENIEKSEQYAMLIGCAVSNMFNDDNEYHIDPEELIEGDNLTHFFHALANMVPTLLFNKLTNDNKNLLEFNHTANQLVFQYTKSEKKVI